MRKYYVLTFVLCTAFEIRAESSPLLDYNSFNSTKRTIFTENSMKLDESDLVLSDEALNSNVGNVNRVRQQEIKLSNDDEVSFDAPIDPSYLNEKPSNAYISAKEEAEDDLDDELYFDDFSDLGIDINEINKPKKHIAKKINEAPLLPIVEEKKIDLSLLQLSCDEFSGRLAREAFSSCGILSKEYKNSKIELTLDESGRISTYDSSLNLADNKKLCLSGYVANKPAKNMGANFTCRVYFQ